MEQLDLDLLSVFVAVVESSSFSAAAKKLGLPKSSVSRAIARLEDAVGAELLHRTTRRVALSTAGQTLHDRVAPLLTSLRDAVGTLPEREEVPSGNLRVTAPNDLGTTWLPDLIAQFTARYPAVNVDVRLTARVVDLVAEGFDVALRASGAKLADSSLIMRKLVDNEMQYFAAPKYLAARGTPRSLAQLEEHDLVSFRGSKPVRPDYPRSGRIRILGDDFLFIREAVRAAAGIGLMPAFLASEDVAAGRMVRVLPRHSQQGGAFVLLYPKTRQVPKKVTAFRDFVVEYASIRPLAPS